jgi:serine/threonine protein kinase
MQPVADAFPRSFGRYTLLEHLAQGGMGSLYLACQGEPGMEKLCVVKTVLRELADKEYVARFRDEAKVVVRLSHGNLVPVFDAGTVEGELYIAMDHVDGRDLRAVWNQCAKKGIAFPVDVAVYLVKELARGLHHAHTAGDLKLVHRDVSPPNVLLAYSGEVKLTDFGLASSTLKLEHTAPGVIYGKVSYMAPEQARGEPLDGRADIYAAGVILWELLTGRQLFPNTDGDALARVRSPQIMPPSSRASRVSAWLDGIVMKALAVERDERYPDAESFRAALAGFLAKEAPTTDTARVAGFLRDLFGDEIERDRVRREALIEEGRKAVAARTAQSKSAPSPRRASSPILLTGGKASGDIEEPEGDGDDPEDDDEDRRSAGVLGATLDGRYRVIRLIGEGGMGRVYEGEHIEIGKRVAIKVLHPRYSEMPEVVARFRREARAASRIGHPNIVDVTDFGTTASGAVYFVMEFLEGADLADVIEREKVLGLDRAVHIAIQLARALEAAHTANVIHRDLKPENIFLVARAGHPDFVKVLDFGIARHLELEHGKRLTRPDMAMGTPEYMAPEQAAGKPTDGRADVYAAGAILYEMLTGSSPHPGDNAMEILNKKATEIPTPVGELRPDVPRALSDIIDRSLARDPLKRQQSMAELAKELERCRPDRRSRDRGRPAMAWFSLGEASAAARAAIAGGSLLVLGLIAAVV